MWINGSAGKEELLKKGEELSESKENWQREIGSFLKDWFNDEDHVKIQTSGSTGKPKTFELSKDLMKSSAEKTADFFGLKNNASALLCLSAGYIAGKMMLVRAVEFGWQMKCEEPSSLPNAENEKLDFSAMVPLQIETLLNKQPQKLENINQIIVGGAPVSTRLGKRLQGLKNHFFATYGMTETASHVALRKLNGLDRSDYFRLLPAIKANQDSRGCLIVQMEVMKEEIITNDLVEFEDFNEFRWIGRIDNVINSGGVKISPEQVEKKIEPLLDRRFYISSKEDESLGQKVILNIESKPLDRATENLLWSELEDTLEKFELPKEIIYHDKFDETSTGKVKRI